MRVFYAAGLIVLAVAVVVFCVQNLETVSVAFLGWSVNIPLPLLVLLVYLFGMLSGWGLLAFLRRSIHRATAAKE